MTDARSIRVTGIVQGVGFRPFVARLAETHRLTGWVLNGPHGVEIHIEGPRRDLDAFARAIRAQAPAAARVDMVEATDIPPTGSDAFQIRPSDCGESPTVHISPDLPVCDECLREMTDPGARRFQYPYINCTHCGPRYSVIRALPYDRERTTVAAWTLCGACSREYRDPLDRRYHAEPVACPQCGPQYRLVRGGEHRGEGAPAIAAAAHLLRLGAIVAVKGIGGYHLSCDAANPTAVRTLRERKYRKSRPFAVMARNLDVARTLVDLDDEAESLLMSPARPIVIAPARVALPEVAPGHRDLGVMVAYAPIHHVLFGAGAPDVLIMTSANRASEPIAFEDGDALEQLDGIADIFLVGERPIARRIDDSIVRSAHHGPTILRRGRGYAPGVVARLPASPPILAVGADLKNAITLVVTGEALTSQHIGDLEHFSAYEAFRRTIRDLTEIYAIDWDDVAVVHDLHPHYASTAYARALPAASHVAVQHHRAHVASVLGERGAFDARVVGVAFDGTGFGDDGTIWGGEFFVGSLSEGLTRAASLRPFALPGGDAAARHPVQAAAGLLADVRGLPELSASPFLFPSRYGEARRVAKAGLRTFVSTSAGRLFDCAAALLGFTREVDYEGQAAIWLEQLACTVPAADALPFELGETHLDFQPALLAIIERRIAGVDAAVLARAFHETIARGIAATAQRLCDAHGVETIVLSGGTFQNALLIQQVWARVPPTLHIWVNHIVPPNDGGISLGQAALAAITPAKRSGVEGVAFGRSADIFS